VCRLWPSSLDKLYQLLTREIRLLLLAFIHIVYILYLNTSEYKDKDIYPSTRTNKRQRSVSSSPEARGSGHHKKRKRKDYDISSDEQPKAISDRGRHQERRGKKRSLEEREFMRERDRAERRRHQSSSPEASKPRSLKSKSVYTSSSDSSESSVFSDDSDSSHSGKCTYYYSWYCLFCTVFYLYVKVNIANSISYVV